ncbi:C3a anaphylatoxin chemotactic receptor-like [Bufo gargarizans]|uniref:C3a anaphylatoxin chemotactic receptor-like n=1 Tax=Bufo gargarizans TaxID=30331 RepID=UPI001CF224E5|nr:C3a anaphylatoxin chemotactic receptor-like [Bufo gargarizans]
MTITFTLYIIIFVLGTIGNGLVIWIAGFRMKKTISTVWFLNLAIADFLCCASLPLRITEWSYFFSNYVEHTEDFCIANIILFNLNVSASVLLLTAMSIDRCVSVLWPFWAKVHRTHRLVRISAAIIWVLSLLLTGIVYYLYRVLLKDIFEWCILSWIIKNNLLNRKRTIQLIRLLIMFLIPFLIILISYVIVFLKIRKCKRSHRSQRPYRIITAVILGFFICWLPYYIWPLTPIYYKPSYDIQFYVVNTIVTNLACLNSCINPIIYIFMGQNVKIGFFGSIPSRLQRAFSEHPNDLQEDYEHTATTDV